jgi:Uma2 family endonuclease
MTVAATPPLEPLSAADQPPRRKFTREEYHLAGEAGVFGPTERLELIHGEVICKVSPQSEPHAYSVSSLADAFRDAITATQLAGRYHIREEKPIVVSDFTEPEPDVTILRGPRVSRKSLPAAQECALVCEISNSTLAFDRVGKAAIYAASGIQEYWIVNLPGRQIEILRDPQGTGDTAGYATRMVAGPEDTISPLENPAWAVRVGDVLPAP